MLTVTRNRPMGKLLAISSGNGYLSLRLQDEKIRGAVMAKVAIAEFESDVRESLVQALRLIGSINDLNKADRPVVIKVGIFDHRTENHTTIDVTDAIVGSFNKAPQIYLAESDNYRGKGLERLQIWKSLFSERVVPFNLSDDLDAKKVKVANGEMNLSHILFKPNVLVSTHIMRTFERGSILKNLFGLVPERKKARFHKKLDTLLLDIYEAIGGIDLAVLDGTYAYRGAGANPHAGTESKNCRIRTNVLLVGRDAIAVETVGATLVGLKPEKLPIIQEAVRRGLGEGDIRKIEIVGASFGSIDEKFSKVRDAFKEKRKRA